MNQKQRVLNYLKTGELTQLEAFNRLGCCRLSERIRELEADGYLIEHLSVKVPTREGMARVTRYRLIQ